MTRRVNQTTGREEELMPDGSWVPVTTPSPLAAATSPGGISPPSPSGFGGGSTENPQPQRLPGGGPALNIPPDLMEGVGDRIQQAWDVGFPQNRGYGQAPTASDFGSSVGADVGQYAVNNPAQPLTFGSGILPEDQAYIDAITQALSGLGGGSTVQAPQLPEIPTQMFEADPGLQTMADHAGRRQTQIDDLISTLRADSQSTLDRNTNKWVTLGRWLSDWSSTGDWAQAGAAMTRVLAQNEDMRRELRDETLQYIQMGWSAEDAVVQAQAALLSGQAQARRELAAAQYNRGTAQTQLDFNAQVANSESASRGASTRANAALAIAEALRGAQGRARESRSTAAQALAGDPRYSNQAFGVLAGNVTDDPATQQALTGSMAEQQLNMALMGYVAQYAGSDDRQALRFLQQWDPRLRLNDLQNSTPQQLMLRLVRTPESRQAFARNRDYLLRSQQFGGMVAPAQ